MPAHYLLLIALWTEQMDYRILEKTRKFIGGIQSYALTSTDPP